MTLNADSAPVIHNRPRDMTPEENEACVVWFATLPLAELRRRQLLVRAQQSMAFDQRNETAMADLDVMDNHLFDAILRQLDATQGQT